jgi:hypothetical protein
MDEHTIPEDAERVLSLTNAERLVAESSSYAEAEEGDALVVAELDAAAAGEGERSCAAISSASESAIVIRMSERRLQSNGDTSTGDNDDNEEKYNGRDAPRCGASASALLRAPLALRVLVGEVFLL